MKENIKMVIRPVTVVQRRAAKISIITGILFLVILVSLHFLEPEFAAPWHFISEFELGNFGWLMHIAFFVYAISFISASVALFAHSRKVIGYIGLAFIELTALGLIIAGIFTTDPNGISQAAATFSGKMHDFGASLNFFPLAALLLIFTLFRQSIWRPIHIWLFIATGIILLVNVAFLLAFPHNLHFGPGTFTGLFGRILLVSYLPWLLIVGVNLLKLSD